MIKFKVVKLFGTHDINIDLTKRCVLMVGENGVGKTTILTILKCLINGDFYTLTRYPFEKIVLRGSRLKVEIQYTDLFPEKDDLLTLLESELTHDNSISVRKQLALEKSEVAYKNSGLDLNLEYFYNLIRSNSIWEYCNYISSLFWNDDSDDESKEYWEYQLQDIVDYFKSQLHDLIFDGCLLMSPISKRGKFELIHEKTLKIFKMYKDDSLDIDDIVFPDIDDIDFNKLKLNIPDFENDDIENLQEEKTRGSNSDSEPLPAEPVFFYDAGQNFRLTNKFEKRYKPQIKDFIPTTSDEWIQSELGRGQSKEAYEYFASAYKRPTLENKKMISLGTIPLGAIIANNYFSSADLRLINKKAYEYFKDLMDINPEEAEENFDFEKFYNENQEFIVNFIWPALIQNSVFDRLIKSHFSIDPMTNKADIEFLAYSHKCNLDLYNYPYPFYNIDVAFKKFILENFQWLKSLKPVKIKLYEKNLNTFLFNKKVSVYPNGLLIRNSAGNEIDISLLSSGEKKIISLLTLATFFNNSILLLDEPEISLSIVWQSWLLPTLLKANPSTKIIVASHSPYIAEEKSMHKYLTPLYTEIVGD